VPPLSFSVKLRTTPGRLAWFPLLRKNIPAALAFLGAFGLPSRVAVVESPSDDRLTLLPPEKPV